MGEAKQRLEMIKGGMAGQPGIPPDPKLAQLLQMGRPIEKQPPDPAKAITGVLVFITTGTGEIHRLGLTREEGDGIIRRLLQANRGQLRVLKKAPAPAAPEPPLPWWRRIFRRKPDTPVMTGYSNPVPPIGNP